MGKQERALFLKGLGVYCFESCHTSANPSSEACTQVKNKRSQHVSKDLADLDELLKEGRTIQQHIPKASPSSRNDQLSRSFANLMFQGKTKAALRLLSEESKGAVLQLDDPIDTGNEQTTVRDILANKHPPGHTQTQS